MGKQKLNAGKVLEALKAGKSVQQIAQESGAKLNAVYTARARLIRKNLWKPTEVTEQKTIEKPTQQKEFTIDDFTDAVLKRIENSTNLETENETLKKENYDLRNKLKMAENELIIAKDELKNKPEMQERIRKVAKAINMEQMKLSQEAAK